MAITLGTDARNAACDAVVNRVNSGTLRLRDGATTLCDIPLETNAFEAAGTNAAGAARAIGADGTNPIGSGNPLSGTAAAAGDADNYQVLNSSSGVEWSGVVSASGGGGDLTLDNTNIANGQTVTITSWTHTAPA